MRSAVSEEESEIFLSPSVTYGPLGLDLSCPIAVTVAHCAEVASNNWTIRLKRQAQDNKWEVSYLTLRPNTDTASQGTILPAAAISKIKNAAMKPPRLTLMKNFHPAM